ncbi:ATP-binding protein [Luteirhabdus pelagi]|uniref:ATP-binding protein n=1 Tax=Luteirhabdus pelagi TaxID=2792783 RepID=UPI001939AEE3|nr:ATP-binding protein [Luteirhabdus pelagi]
MTISTVFYIRIDSLHHFKRFSLSFLQCCFWVFINGIATAQESPPTDKLEKLIPYISDRLQGDNQDSTELYTLVHRAVALSEAARDNQLLGQSYRHLAYWHLANPELDSSLYYFEKARQIYQQAKLDSLQAETYLEMEDAYKQRGYYTEAMEQDFKALELFEKNQLSLGIAKSYTRLCDILYYQEKYAEGAEYCQKAIDIQSKYNVPEELAISHRYKADNLLILEKFEAALEEINKGIAVLKAAGKSEKIIAPNYNTRGNIYKYMERFDEAIAEYQKVYALAKVENNTQGLISALGNLGHVKRLQERYEEALPYTLEALEIIEQSGNTRNLFENYMHASDSYAALGQFEEALKYERLFSGARFRNLEKTIEQLESELQIKYETAQKEATIEEQEATIDRQRKIQLLYIGIAVLLGIILFGMYFTITNIRKKRKALASLNTELEQKKEALETSNRKLQQSFDELKATQAQLIQSEKMASLGELTAGIAHEIQNPLNFVNNFSEVSRELITEMQQEIQKGDLVEITAISEDIKNNLEKIQHHGQRADAIVKGMLLHSRSSSGNKEATDLNKLCDEYLRLSYHGLRAKDKNFNATLETDFDPNLPSLQIIPQDMGRVVLNLLTNAFYAVRERQKMEGKNYKPTVIVATAMEKDGKEVSITIKDNGNGIPKEIQEKIFQPFFTTKPTGQGTGLGLSLSYDIVKAHGGELRVATELGKGTEFVISLPSTN